MKDMLRQAFERSVRNCFGRLATKLRVQLAVLSDGTFEIESTQFCMRIRASSGHVSDLVDLLVTLVPVEKRFAKFGVERGEISLVRIMDYYGDELNASPVSSTERLKAEIKRQSQLALKYGTLFLSGSSRDWSNIEKYVEQKIIEAGIPGMKFDLPKGVREEWEVEMDEDGS
jgi:hypothetical protein